ncbi:MAG: yhjE 1 [Hydrocarboniphaga sp.]|uniref:MFS transporter n=1 Tax=Hydrocarboniphaga sp. TaxID=2033016 RepID=UPI0026059607|nr:MFS transporter [Hydrocarboniphaga sp.]MDB5971672.1 yhjE 1 [Hydrocarboniphaga sp.]
MTTQAGQNIEAASAASSPRRAALAAFLGSVIEYYDLVVYGSAAALVFGKVFFREVDPHIALIMSFATFATGYLARPLGGLLFGYIGDKRGRRAALMMTITMMGTATVLIGLLPTYDTIGRLAPVLLVILRVIQGLAVGGELGGAVLISVEHAPAHRRGFFGSFSTAGAQAGTVVATTVFALVTLMPDESFIAWGWRLPFLFSAVMVFVGVLVRYGLDETPDFKNASEADKKKNPIFMAFREHWSTILAVVSVMAGMMSIWYILTVYSLSYAVRTVGLDRTSMLWVITVATLLVVIMNPVWGALSDRIGRTRLIVGGLIAEGLMLFLYFATLQNGTPALIFASLLAVAGFGHAVINGVFPAFIVESLPPNVRYTAGSFGMQMASLVAGFAPVVAVSLENTQFGVWATVSICFVLCLVGAASAYKLAPIAPMLRKKPYAASLASESA